MAKKVVDINRLVEAIRSDRKRLEAYRQNRHEAIRQYAGHLYGEDALREKNPINLIGQYLSVIPRFLVPKNPRFLLTTFKPSSKAPCSAMQAWVNQQVDRMELGETLRTWVMDALFHLGIMKVCLADPAESAESGWQIQSGTAVARTVDFTDFVYDTHCRVIERASYAGHRFRCPREVAIELYGKAARDLAVSMDPQYNVDGDERTLALAFGTSNGENEFEEYVDLWEIYCPRQQKVVILSDDFLMGASSLHDKALEEKPWIGPYCGPYIYLKFKPVPGLSMPKGEILDLSEMHVLANNLYRKLGDTADSAKDVGLVPDGATDDAKKIQDAYNLDVLNVSRPDAVQVVHFGNLDQSTYAFMMDNVNRFKEMAGNIDLLGGLNPQSSTATQDKMLNQNAAAGVGDKQQEVLSKTAILGRNLVWFWWNDPFHVMQTTYKPPGLPEATVSRQLYPAAPQYTDPEHPDYRNVDLVRVGPFEDLEIKVDPYSLRFQSPAEKVSQLIQIMTQVVIPLAPMLQPAGITPDLGKFLEIISQYNDMPELQECVTIAEPPTQSQVAAPQGAGQPGQTERRYVRESRSEGTKGGMERNMMQQMMGINPGGNPQRNGQMMPMGAK